MSLQVSNDHNVYIVGAGFSDTAGLPTVRNFLNRMRDSLDWLEKKGRSIEKEAVVKVLNYRLDAASAAYWCTLDLENVEQLFSLASASRDPVSELLPTAIAATLDFTRDQGADGRAHIQLRDNDTSNQLRTKLIGQTQRWGKEAPEFLSRIEEASREGHTTFQVAALLGMLNQDSLPTGQNTFISFNYDTLIEDALTQLRVPWRYGFEWNKANFKQGSADSWGRSKDDKAVPLLKLHGSINWGHLQGAQGANAKLSVFRSYAQLLSAGGRPSIVPPTWNKSIESLISSAWEQAIEQLSTATRIIIIGFSMPETDQHFRYLLAAGLQRNASLRSIQFINPDAKGMEIRSREVLRSSYIDQNLIRFVPAKADVLANALAGDSAFLPSDAQTKIDIGRMVQRKFACHVFPTRLGSGS
jgi:hypothetical protein